MGFDSDEDQDASIEPEEPASPGGSALSSKASALNSGKVEELSKLLELESASLKAAQNELAESEQRARKLQSKFEQVGRQPPCRKAQARAHEAGTPRFEPTARAGLAH